MSLTRRNSIFGYEELATVIIHTSLSQHYVHSQGNCITKYYVAGMELADVVMGGGDNKLLLTLDCVIDFVTNLIYLLLEMNQNIVIIQMS